MNQARFVRGLAAVVLVVGGGLLWRAIQNPICAGFGGGCAPDIAYLIPGALAVLLGVALFGWSYRHHVSGRPAGTEL